MSLARLRRDDGAAAVEFALISVLLLTLIFGIIQYSYYFYQSQGASATARDAARLAAVGVSDCTTFKNSVVSRAADNGLTIAATGVTLSFKDPATAAAASATIGSTALVTVAFTPTRFGFPFVPFITSDDVKQAETRVESVGTVTTTC